MITSFNFDKNVLINKFFVYGYNRYYNFHMVLKLT